MSKRIIYIMYFLIFLLIVGCAGKAFKEAKSIDSVSAYDDFLANYGNSEFVSQANTLREETFFRNVQSINTIKSYNSYIKEYPNGKYIDMANKKKYEIKELHENELYEECIQSESISLCQKYLDEVPKGKYIQQVSETLSFLKAQQQNTFDAMNLFIEEYPNSSFEERALKLREQVKLNRLKSENRPNQVVWSKKRKHTLNAFFDPQSNLFWAIKVPKKYFNPKEISKLRGRDYTSYWSDYGISFAYLSYNNAQTFVSKLIIDGQGNWKLPSKEDVEKADPGFTMIGSDSSFLRDEGSSSCSKSKVPVYGLTSHTSAYCWSESREKTKEYFIPVRNKSIYDQVILDNYKSFEEKFITLTDMILEKKLNVVLKEPVKPKKSDTVVPNKLTKGEFETTTNFAKRVKTEKMRIKKVNENLKQQYKTELDRYNLELEAQKKIYQHMLLQNRKPEIIHQTYEEAASEALVMLLGDPVLSNFQYNADEQIFRGVVQSEFGNFERKVEFFVQREKAKKFKDKLIDTRLIPSITFHIDWPKLIFSDLKIVTNTFKEEQDYALAKKKDTINAYETFIKYHPEAPQIIQAKRRINEIIEKQEKERLAQMNWEIEQDRKRVIERQAYMKSKNVGNLVCKEARILFGFISVTISAYVERISGDDIQIRINSTEGQNINYKGGELYQGKLLWDKYYEWKHCN